MQKFRNNLITPELAGEMLWQFINDCKLCPLEFGNKDKDVRIHDKEEKIVRRMIQTIADIEFTRCPRIKEVRLTGFDGLRLRFSIRVYSEHPYTKENSDDEAAGFNEDTQVALDAALFFNEASNEKIKIAASFELLCHQHLSDADEISLVLSDYSNAALEVKRS